LLQVRDELARLDGVGDIMSSETREYLAIWLDPNKTAARGLTAQDVVQALQEQNVGRSRDYRRAAGAEGATAFQYTVNAADSRTKEFSHRS
jgi:multidrug efflux pump subunit AcrB